MAHKIMISFLIFSTGSVLAEVTDSVAGEIEKSGRIKLSDKEKKAPLLVYVDKSANVQMMHVFKRGVEVGVFPVSTGRELGESNYKNPNFEPYCSSTPTGNYRPTVVKDIHNSSQWSGAAMYDAIFFKGGYAIHGVDDKYYSDLGSRASGGCVRLHRNHSKQLIDWVRAVGQRNVTIKVEDSSPLLQRYKIEDSCFNQKKVINCTRRELRRRGHYDSSNRTTRTINGQVFTSYNIDRGEAYGIEENECRPRLAAKGAFYKGPPRHSLRPRPRPRRIDACENSKLPKANNPACDEYRDGLF